MTPVDEVERRAQEAMHELLRIVYRMDDDERRRGAALRKCVAASWTVADLARQLGVTRGTIYRWMNAGGDDDGGEVTGGHPV